MKKDLSKDNRLQKNENKCERNRKNGKQIMCVKFHQFHRMVQVIDRI